MTKTAAVLDRAEDHLHRESAAIWRGDPAGGRGQGAGRAAAGALGLDGGRARVRHLGLLAVMSFEHEEVAFNLLDTPDHQDFSEDTYRFRLSTDQPCVCHNRMLLPRISAPTIGRAVRFGGSWRYLIST